MLCPLVARSIASSMLPSERSCQNFGCPSTHICDSIAASVVHSAYFLTSAQYQSNKWRKLKVNSFFAHELWFAKGVIVIDKVSFSEKERKVQS